YNNNASSPDTLGSRIGNGWDHNYNIHYKILIDPRTAFRSLYLYEGNGRIAKYDEVDYGVYVNPKAPREITTISGGQLSVQFENGSQWILSAPNNEERGYIQESRDRLGNKMTFDWGDPVEVNSTAIGLALEKIVDTLGREIV